MEDWALIRRLAAEGVPKAAIAQEVGDREEHGGQGGGLGGARRSMSARPAPTSFTAFEPRVRELLTDTPDMPATVLAERVGWTGSIRWFRDNVDRLRAEHRPIDPADRLTWAAGDAAQCDLWFPPRKIPLEDGTAHLVAGAGHDGRALAVHARPDDPVPEDRGPAAGLVGAAASSWGGSRAG